MKFLVSVLCFFFVFFAQEQPVQADQCCGEATRNIPTQCEVDTLITMLELAVAVDLKLSARWLRLAFHDAGTFDKEVPEGGANGCLMNFPPMRDQPENNRLNDPINTLAAIKLQFEDHNSTCIETSSADVIQFAGLFAVIRQMSPTGMTSEKREFLKNNFAWGRTDEPDCDTEWTHNLPGFRTGTGRPMVTRCVRNGGEIKEKMMDRNGFTAEEATALIGAHTIGLIRFTFGSLKAPWVPNGDDDATPNGPVFDNAYHSFLINEIEANTCEEFANNQAPFNEPFPNWFQQKIDRVAIVDHLDTDIAIAFPSQDTSVHPNFNTFTEAFAGDNEKFVNTFLAAYDKMSKLGVTDALASAETCRASCSDDGGEAEFEVTQELDDFVHGIGYANAKADAENRRAAQELLNETEQLTEPLIPTAPPTFDPTAVCDVLSWSDQEIWDFALSGERIGQYCYIGRGGPGNACDFYGRGRRDPITGHNGVPLNRQNRGTGCMKDEPGDFCFFSRDEYDLTQEERDSMCSDDGVANGAAQMRYGIINGRCTDAPVVCATPPKICEHLQLSDEELWNLATSGETIGDYCKIRAGWWDGARCPHYAVGRRSESTGFLLGVPRDNETGGIGCIDHNGGWCPYNQAKYDNVPDEDRDSFCTNDEKANGAAQIRYGIQNGECTDEPVQC